MNESHPNRFSGPVTIFHERRLPEVGTPAGYAALINAYRLAVPLPRQLAAIGTRHRITDTPEWRLFTPRHAPEASLEGHLTFALKYEGLDLAVLKRLFLAVGPADVAPRARYANGQLRSPYLVSLRMAHGDAARHSLGRYGHLRPCP